MELRNNESKRERESCGFVLKVTRECLCELKNHALVGSRMATKQENEMIPLEELEEVQLLLAMYPDEITLTPRKPNSDSNSIGTLAIIVTPRTAMDEATCFIRGCLTFHISSKHPDEPPRFSLSDMKGLPDDLIRELQRLLETKSKELVGQPSLFELIEVRLCEFCCFCFVFWFFLFFFVLFLLFF